VPRGAGTPRDVADQETDTLGDEIALAALRVSIGDSDSLLGLPLREHPRLPACTYGIRIPATGAAGRSLGSFHSSMRQIALRGQAAPAVSSGSIPKDPVMAAFHGAGGRGPAPPGLTTARPWAVDRLGECRILTVCLRSNSAMRA
jgi:hypothetical protein